MRIVSPQNKEKPYCYILPDVVFIPQDRFSVTFGEIYLVILMELDGTSIVVHIEEKKHTLVNLVDMFLSRNHDPVNR